MIINLRTTFHATMSFANSSSLRLSSCHPCIPKRHRRTRSLILSALRTSRSMNEFDGDGVLEAFVQERQLNGDFIAKLSDKIWLKATGDTPANNKNKMPDDFSGEDALFPPQEMVEESEGGGFLKLKSTKEWVLGDAITAPANKKKTAKELQNDSEKRRKLSLLGYEALKRELLLLTVGIGTACTGYCLIVLSAEAALSYAIGVLLSCIYLQLLCQQADNISKRNVPDIFMQKKSKKIGIRSEDLEDFFEKSIKGTGFALSSPRLVIPAAGYGLWELSQHFNHVLLDFQLTPAMLGIFAYKAAALVQVYRDNEDLQFIFPENESMSGD